MSVKIRVSYQERAELDRVLKLLRPEIKSCKISQNNDGNFRKAYIQLDERTTSEARVNTERSSVSEARVKRENTCSGLNNML